MSITTDRHAEYEALRRVHVRLHGDNGVWVASPRQTAGNSILDEIVDLTDSPVRNYANASFVLNSLVRMGAIHAEPLSGEDRGRIKYTKVSFPPADTRSFTERENDQLQAAYERETARVRQELQTAAETIAKRDAPLVAAEEAVFERRFTEALARHGLDQASLDDRIALAVKRALAEAQTTS